MNRQRILTASIALSFLSISIASAAEPEIQKGVRLALGLRTQGWAAPEVVDWNNDGLNDVLVGYYSGALALYLNRGWDKDAIVFEKADIQRQDRFAKSGEPIWSWRFNKATCICPGPGRISPRVVDWNGDGKKDLLIGDGNGSQTRVWRNVGTDAAPVFSTHHLQYLPEDGGIRPYHETVQPYIADWNGDGRKDLVMGRNRGVYLYLNHGTNGNPAFDFAQRRLGTKLRAVFPTERLCPVVVDWDEDGKQDLLVGSQQGEVWFARNVGSKTQPVFRDYTRVQAIGKAVNVRGEARIAVADLDGDGQKDLLVGGTSGVVWFYRASNNPDTVKRVEYKSSVPPAATERKHVSSATPDGPRRAAAADNVPVVDIKFQSPVIEPATPGVLTITRKGNIAQPVTVKLITRRTHDPVVEDLHFVPTPSSVTLKAGQTAAELRVKPIDDTLATGRRTLAFQIVADPAYRLTQKTSEATMVFLDDDCPQVSIRVAKGAPNTFEVTAEPAPRRDTEIAYSVSGAAVNGVDYQRLSGVVTIAAGKTSATITVKPYRSTLNTNKAKKRSVTLKLPVHRFTFFDFYSYLAYGGSRTATLSLKSSEADPLPPQTHPPRENPMVMTLRQEVSQLGWIVFAARGPANDLDLFVMRPDGSSLRNLTNTSAFDEYSARVSPDGKRMLYRRAKAGQKLSPLGVRQFDVATKALKTWPQAAELVIANFDGSDPRPLGNAHAWATWGPRGKRIACLEENKIAIHDADTLQIVQSLPSTGISSHAVWSPDGKRICGPANIPPGRTRFGKGIEYPLGQGKMVSLDIATGKRTAMARFPDLYPVWAVDSDGDWFQDGSPEILHSANNYGVCPAYYATLWRSGLKGKPSQLVFAEYMKNVWSGCTSPDGKYAVFVISGDAWALSGQMAIVRLSDAPIARGRSKLFHEVLADHFPDIKQGPVFDLPHVRNGFDPHWTAAADYEVK